MFTTLLIVVLVGAALGLMGGFLILWKEDFARKLSLYFVAFASGTLLAAAFLDLIPEGIGSSGLRASMFSVLLGFLVFMILEKFLAWYHCHGGECEFHDRPTYVYTIIIGDTLHNFVDGIAIAVSFMINIELGLATAIAVFAHELPQEIGDFGVLLHAGISRAKVAWYNVVSALATPLGAVLGYSLGNFFGQIEGLILAFIAGTFIYVGASDLIPHLHKEWRWKRSLWHVLLMIIGILVIALVVH